MKIKLSSEEILEKYLSIEEVSDDEEDDEESNRKKWVEVIDYAKPENRELIENLVTKIKQKFDCIGDPYAKWIGYTPKSLKKKIIVLL